MEVCATTSGSSDSVPGAQGALPITPGRYVLGTDPVERGRLELQHNLWRPALHEALVRAGVTAGAHVIDVGAGPGLATADLLHAVGPQGTVHALERSPAFVAELQQRYAADSRVTVSQVDLVEDSLPVTPLTVDASWCRWVAMFLPGHGPEHLVRQLAQAIRPGGAAIFQEYVHYQTYGLVPFDPDIHSFHEQVMRSFASGGGQTNIAGRLLRALADSGFAIEHVRTIIHAARPQDPFWQWPSSFLRIYAPRLVEQGLADEAWLARALAALDRAERDPASVFTTPAVLEIVARRLAP
ncbi:MAG: methyltransferase domain-containing protein [Phycisphaerales bacterium]|nr:methyltransferase domain-containing protein [Phycisphaerales bacterium]